jgi:tRNA(fMet)-specific endonuclease VapC
MGFLLMPKPEKHWETWLVQLREHTWDVAIEEIEDTDICIYLMAGGYPKIEQRLFACQPDEVVLSAIAVAELRYGAENSRFPARNHQTLDVFLSGFSVLPFDHEANRVYGEVRAFLKKQGLPIGSEDTFIAGHALAEKLILVTNNVKQFQHVPNLSIENWVNVSYVKN